MNTNFHLSLLVLVFYGALVNGYINVRLEDKLCTSTERNSDITLLEDSDSAAIFTQQWNGTATSPPVACEFKVFSSRDAYRIPKGTYITIAHLNFRKNHQTNECLDYIQFVDGKSPPSKRICEATVGDGPTKSPLIIDHRERDTRVIIHIDNNTKINEPLELRMVMTAHSQCNHKGDLRCNDKVPYSCISRHFVNDSIINCMRPCRDEKSCWPETVDTEHLKAAEKESRQVAEPNYITVRILEQKLKENVELLSAVMKENQASLLSQIDVKISNNREDNSLGQIDVKISNNREGNSVGRADNDDGAAYKYDDDMEACVTKKFFKEKLEEHSQLIINVINIKNHKDQGSGPKNEIGRLESLAVSYAGELEWLDYQMEQLLKNITHDGVNN